MPRRERNDPVDEVEKKRRAKISESLRSSDAQRAYHDRLRGHLKGPDSIETKAAKSASHLAKKGSAEWEVYYESALASFKAREHAQERLQELQQA